MKFSLKSVLLSVALATQIGCAQSAKDTSELFAKPYSQSSSAVFSLGNTQGDILSPEQAFRFQSQIKPESFNFLFDIAPGHYIYKDKLEFRANNIKLDESAIAKSIVFPSSMVVDDPTFGKQSVFKGQIDIALMRSELDENVKEVSLTYYGCSPQGICYVPEVKTISLVDEVNTIADTNVVAQGASYLVYIGIGMLVLVFLIGLSAWVVTKPKESKSV